MTTYQKINGYNFIIVNELDDNIAPWGYCDNEADLVSDWTQRDKKPGEMILNTHRRFKRFFDYQAACKYALKYQWGSRDALPGDTKKQIASKAALNLFNYWRSWFDDEWTYRYVEITLINPDTNQETDFIESCGGIEDLNDYDQDWIKENAAVLIESFKTQQLHSWEI